MNTGLAAICSAVVQRRNEDATLQNDNPAVALSLPTRTGQPPSTAFLTQVVQYIVDHLNVDLSALTLSKKFSLKESVLLPSFQSHTGIALDQFVLRRRIERELHLLKNSDARYSEFAAGVVWETTPVFQAAFVNYLEEVFHRNSRRRLEKGASARPCLTAYRTKNLVDGHFQHPQSSNYRRHLVKRCGHTTV